MLWIFSEPSTQACLCAVQRAHIHRLCLWSAGARRAPTHNWIHRYTEAQLLHGRTQAPREKRGLKYGLQSPLWWPRTHLQISEVKCCPWIIQKQTCRILNFPNLHQLAEYIGSGSLLYYLCMFLLGVWVTFRIIKYFSQQNWWLHVKESPLLPTPLF